MTVAEWLKLAVSDAERRGLPQLTPLLEKLARATQALRDAPWNDDASAKNPDRHA